MPGLVVTKNLGKPPLGIRTRLHDHDDQMTWRYTRLSVLYVRMYSCSHDKDPGGKNDQLLLSRCCVSHLPQNRMK